MVPDFLVIGGMKCGTSALYRYLLLHPEIFLPKKNIEFFNDENWSRGRAWYESFFAFEDPGVKCIGDVSTEYAKFPRRRNVAPRVAEVLPQTKLIYLVRHPVRRMISQYFHLVNELTERRSLEDALGAAENNTYVNFSRYYLQLEQYFPYFERSRILVLSSEELRAEPLRTLNRIAAFIGVSEFVDVPWVEVNTREEKRRWNAAGRRIRAVPKRFARFEYYRTRLPKPAASLVLGAVSSPVEEHALAPELLGKLLDTLAPDTERFYEWAGPAWPRWDLRAV